MRQARAKRYLIALALLAAAIVFKPTDARAQFTCVTGPPIIFCTNTGNEPANFLPGNPIFPYDATFRNLGTAQNITANTAAGGSSFVNNSGTALNLTADTHDTGNATVLNSGQAQRLSATTESGTATVTNSAGASSNRIATTSTLGGSAVSNNFGTTDFMNARTTNGGDAFAFNSGTVVNATGANLSIPGFPYKSGILAYAAGATGNATAINTGTAATTNPNRLALMAVSDGGNATSTNYGSAAGIYTIGGINGGSGNATTINYGTVTGGIISESGYSLGGAAGDAVVFNAGRIFAGVAAFADGTGTATISNAGLIDGTNASQGIAVSLSNSTFNPLGPTVLNILPGSRIIGFIDLNGDSAAPGTGTQVNIFSGRDISSVLTFGGGCGCFNNLIDTGSVVNITGGAPYVIFGNTVAVLDPTSFAVQDKNIADFTHTLSSMVTSRLNNPAPISGGSSVSSFAPSGSVAADMARDAFAGISSLNYASSDRVLFSNPSMTAADGTSVWAQGFAGQRIQDASAPVLRSVNNFYGGMLGIDKAVRPDLRVGVLLGAGNIKSTVDMSSGDTSSDILFGGVYGRYAMNKSFFDFSLIGGHGSNDLRRNMANNLAPNGLETATASYASWFISPEIAYGVRKDIWPNVTLTPTARVRYVAAGFEGYQESGSTTNLTVASRMSHNFEERAELTLNRTSDPVPTQRMQISGTLGALALQRAGDTTVNTILLGQNLPFATPGKNDVYGVYSGVGFDWRNNKGLTVFGAAEYTATTDSSRTATAKGGMRLTF